MLLLYRSSVTSSRYIPAHLHSTMLLLYHKTYDPFKLTEKNLHSTMLLLYPNHGCVNLIYCFIYIPLCFYFIDEAYKQFEQQFSFTFHYASTLSPELHPRFCISDIYIPLCFYFIRIPCRWCSFYDLIYIPLCFYFIQTQNILRQTHLNLHSTMLLLYRKIWDLHRLYLRSNLHSTMLLLYPYSR